MLEDCGPAEQEQAPAEQQPMEQQPVAAQPDVVEQDNMRLQNLLNNLRSVRTSSRPNVHWRSFSSPSAGHPSLLAILTCLGLRAGLSTRKT